MRRPTAWPSVRGIQDTSRQGRWHNKRFAVLAGELGLMATKDERIGWSPCTLRPDTADHYAAVLADLGAAMRAFRHIDEPGGTTRTTTTNNRSEPDLRLPAKDPHHYCGGGRGPDPVRRLRHAIHR